MFCDRKKLRLGEWDYSNSGYYFITICTKDKHNLFWAHVGNGHARSAAGTIAEENLLAIPFHYPHVKIDKYVIMPNHIHAILVIDSANMERACPFPTLSTIIGSYKSSVSRAIGYPIWQKSFYDHIIRGEQDYREIWQYIENNPIKWEQDRFFTTDL